MDKKIIVFISLLVLIVGIKAYSVYGVNDTVIISDFEIKEHDDMDDDDSITISAVGDCTLGTDTNFSYSTSLNKKMEKVNDYSYFFGGVYSVLNNDDLTIANLEGTFTDATVKKVKQFNFKGPKDYVNILIKGSIEAVNIANNHTYDYLEKGYQDTKSVLKDAEIEYFGYENYSIVNVKGFRIGLYGSVSQDVSRAKKEIDLAMNYFNEQEVDLVIYSFHWGIEKSLIQNSTQTTIAHYAIDKGVGLVLGHHPHVLQGIEVYKGKYIVYSLANFVFGGNSYPYDLDSMIFQIKYKIVEGKIVFDKVNVIPVLITSSGGRVNDYRPMILEGSNRQRVLNKIMKYSVNFKYNY